MVRDRRIIEGIEACRPGSDDLAGEELADVAQHVAHDPEAQRLYRAVQRSDAAIGAAISQGDVPEGLAERLMARLAAARATDEALSGAADAAPSVEPVIVGAPGHRTSRRRWLVAASTIAAAVVIGGFATLWLRPGNFEPPELLAEQWMQELSGKWKDVSLAPREFQLPAAIIASPTGWQSLRGYPGAAFRLTAPRAAPATLFVVRVSASGLPSAAPARPQSTTGGRAIGYWQSGGLVYVLVVEGNEHSYRSFVSSSPTPLA